MGHSPTLPFIVKTTPIAHIAHLVFCQDTIQTQKTKRANFAFEK